MLYMYVCLCTHASGYANFNFNRYIIIIKMERRNIEEKYINVSFLHCCAVPFTKWNVCRCCGCYYSTVACIYCRTFPLARQFTLPLSLALLFVIYYPRNVGRTDILTAHENQFAMRQIVYLLSVLWCVYTIFKLDCLLPLLLPCLYTPFTVMCDVCIPWQ